MRSDAALPCAIKWSRLLPAICILVVAVTLQAQVMSFAGLESTLPATGLTAPVAVALDTAGNRYIVSHLLPNVIEIGASGTQTTIPVSLGDPRSIAVDAGGNLYIADYQKTYIVEVPALGGSVIEVGSNMAQPSSVAVDHAGNVYVAETGHTRILKVAAGGSPQTVVGAGLFPFINPVGVAVDANGNLYVSDIGAQSLIEVTFAGSMASESTLLSGLTDQPYDVAYVSAGEILLSGGISQQLTMHQVAASAGVAGTVYQLGTGLVNPSGIAVDPAGNVYVADQADPAIDIIAPGSVNLGQANLCPTAGIQTAPCSQTVTLHFNVAGGASLASVAVALVTQGGQGLDFSTVYPAGGNTCAGALTGPATCAIPITFNPLAPGRRLGSVEVTGIVAPSAAAVSLASVPLYGLGVGPIAGFDAGAIETLPLNLGSSASPSSVIMDSGGNLYLVDSAACVVKKLSFGATAPVVVAGSGACGSPSGNFGPATSAVLQHPSRIALNGRGDLYISDDLASVIWKVDALTQIISTVAGQPGTPGYSSDGILARTASLDAPLALAFDGAGDLYFTDYHDQIVRRIDATTGVLSTVAGLYIDGAGYSGDGGAATGAQLHNPAGLAFDSSGNLYIADAGNQVVREVTASTGIISTVAGTAATAGYTGDNGAATGAELSNPEGIAVDAAGNLYIADSGNYAVRKVSAVPFSSTVSAGTITTAVGTGSGTAQYTGDGGAANLAGVSDVADVAIDGSGNLYLADTSNHVIREVTPANGVVTFLTANVGAASPALDVFVTNSGNAPLSLSALLAPASFSLGGADTSCTASTLLTAGASCTLGIEFTPVEPGALTGTFTLTDDAGNNPASTQSLALSGAATVVSTQLALGPVAATIAPGSNLGTVLVSIENSAGVVVTTSTANVTVTVTGAGGYSGTVTAAAASGVASLDLSGLTLAAAGTYTLTATSTGLTPSTATVLVALQPAQLAFGLVPATIAPGGNLGTILVSLESLGGAVVTISTLNITVTVTGPGGYSAAVDAAAASGVASLDLAGMSLIAAGAYTLTATSPGLPSATTTVVVVPAAAKLAVSGILSSITAGGNLGIAAVSVEDATGAVVGSSTASVAITISGPGGYSQKVTASAVNGVATLDLSSFALQAAGVYTVTVSSMYLPNTSLNVTVVEATFSLTPSGAAGGTAPTQTVAAGGAATYLLTLGATSGTHSVTFSAAGLPPGATATFAPATLTLGPAPTTTTLTIQTAATTAALHDPADMSARLAGIAMSLLLLPFAASRRLRKASAQRPMPGLMLGLLAVAAWGLAGCGGGDQKSSTPTSQTYTVTVTGTSGSISESTTVTLVVQ